MMAYPKESFVEYTLEFVFDCALGVVLGLFTNFVSDQLQKFFGYHNMVKLIMQLLLIAVFLYVFKYFSSDIARTWRNEMDYGIVFIAMFLASQKNFVYFMKMIAENKCVT